jgi:hypothetical protein
LLERVLASCGAVYNMELMSMEEYLESPIYTCVLHVHEIRHVIEVPS